MHRAEQLVLEERSVHISVTVTRSEGLSSSCDSKLIITSSQGLSSSLKEGSSSQPHDFKPMVTWTKGLSYTFQDFFSPSRLPKTRIFTLVLRITFRR